MPQCLQRRNSKLPAFRFHDIRSMLSRLCCVLAKDRLFGDAGMWSGAGELVNPVGVSVGREDNGCAVSKGCATDISVSRSPNYDITIPIPNDNRHASNPFLLIVLYIAFTLLISIYPNVVSNVYTILQLNPHPVLRFELQPSHLTHDLSKNAASIPIRQGFCSSRFQRWFSRKSLWRLGSERGEGARSDPS
ncbi:hypothetical protein FGG08_001498 [Glutinoglossum americanum]|uniref:Uncharacterized protein n=1 Tax=Glutinoglossum americanum TaxID=1670608 RepID=A0A9P8IEP6_9PEZI|nr:hypothetical protein FGG08_001498 [Glutinoglossum americanum]